MLWQSGLPEIGIDLLRSARYQGFTLKMFGSLAFWYRCLRLRHRFEIQRPEPIRDLDFVALFRQKRAIEEWLSQLGWELDHQIRAIPGIRCSVLYFFENGQVIRRCDIYYDILDFCHRIDIRNRLRSDDSTIPLAELLLSKLQIREKRNTDVFDLQMILLEHETGDADGNTINVKIIADLCSRDWGLWKTSYDSLELLEAAAKESTFLSSAEVVTVVARIEDLRRAIHDKKKTWWWKIRNCIGDRVRWYQEVDPIGFQKLT